MSPNALKCVSASSELQSMLRSSKSQPQGCADLTTHKRDNDTCTDTGSRLTPPEYTFRAQSTVTPDKFSSKPFETAMSSQWREDATLNDGSHHTDPLQRPRSKPGCDISVGISDSPLHKTSTSQRTQSDAQSDAGEPARGTDAEMQLFMQYGFPPLLTPRASASIPVARDLENRDLAETRGQGITIVRSEEYQQVPPTTLKRVGVSLSPQTTSRSSDDLIAPTSPQLGNSGTTPPAAPGTPALAYHPYLHGGCE